MNQAEEIVNRNKGNIKDLLKHIEQDIHITAIMQQRLDDGIHKSFLQAKLIQLQQIKSELQQALSRYQGHYY